MIHRKLFLRIGLVFTTAGFGHFWEVLSLKINDFTAQKNLTAPRIREVGLAELVRMAEKVGHFLSKVLVDLYQRVIADPSNRGVLLVNSAAL
jgi:hypothetical protein